MTSWPLPVDTVLLDVDGTLVDSNYHHTLAWWRAFREHEQQVPAWRIHRALGMGGDRLVTEVAGSPVEDEIGDDVRAAWERHYDAVLAEVRPFYGAPELIAELRERGLRVALASSGIPRHTRHAIEVLDAGRRADATTSADAEASKPDPELLQVALDRVDASRAVLVGDSVWDVRSAVDAGIAVIGVQCGGFSREELERAGADRVERDVETLLGKSKDLVTLH
jgi:HAD superfamily hydrolase (TIGR01509 family)